MIYITIILPDTPLVVLPDVEGVTITAGWDAGDKVAEKCSEIDNWTVYIYYMYFSRANIMIIVYIVRNNQIKHTYYARYVYHCNTCEIHYQLCLLMMVTQLN